MKIVVMSDSHGNAAAVRKVVQHHEEDVDLFLHLGDGEHDMSVALQSFPWLAEKFHYLKGNCDFGDLVKPTQRQLVLELPFGHKIFAAHGDHYRVNYGTDRIVHEAKQAGANIVLFGHTHERICTYEDGLYIVNPGSLACPRDGKPPAYALISVSEKGILIGAAEL